MTSTWRCATTQAANWTLALPPYGYGQLGAFSPQDGFHTAENSVVVDTDNQRMLVSGQDVQQGYRLPCLLALSLKPDQ